VPLVQQSIQFTATPQDAGLMARPERAEDVAELGHADARKLRTFDARDRRLMEPYLRRQIRLPPPEAPSERPTDQSDAHIVHRAHYRDGH
jgi:hypothetical protein